MSPLRKANFCGAQIETKQKHIFLPVWSLIYPLNDVSGEHLSRRKTHPACKGSSYSVVRIVKTRAADYTPSSTGAVQGHENCTGCAAIRKCSAASLRWHGAGRV